MLGLGALNPVNFGWQRGLTEVTDGLITYPNSDNN